MARRPQVADARIRRAIADMVRRHGAALAHGSRVMREHHGSTREPVDHQADAEARASLILAGGDVDVCAADLWQALSAAGADDLAEQIRTLDRTHHRPGRPVRFRLDDREELHLVREGS